MELVYEFSDESVPEWTEHAWNYLEAFNVFVFYLAMFGLKAMQIYMDPENKSAQQI